MVVCKSQPYQRRKEAAWLQIYNEFSPAIVDKSGLEKYSKHLWHRQLHIFEVPFYYIEYGMAQLGAIAIWKRYRENPTEALEDYIQALKLGYTKKLEKFTLLPELNLTLAANM
ncbi:MAG: hypothetical protein R2784_16660 [Saprospiraceae bacterium]